jgi:metacaspase-1
MANRALLAGINAYPGQPLNGCVNDVNDMARFLVGCCGFRSSEVRLVVDARATTAHLRERLEWLVAGARPGDRLFFHYSGHGARFPVRNAQGEVTAVHDTICPVDFDWSEAHALLDVNLQAIIDKVPEGTEFVYVSDSCNSGDLTRELRPFGIRAMIPPADIAWRLRTARDLSIEPSHLIHDRCALISGCRSDQTSADAVFGNRYNGALTYYLLQSLQQASGLGAPLTQLVPDVVQRLAKGGYDQVPQLRGPDAISQRAFLARAKQAAGATVEY